MNNEIEITLGTSMILTSVIDELLHEKYIDKDGNPATRDRDLPFRLRYRLSRTALALEKDSQIIENAKLYYMADLGEPTEDGKNVAIKDPDKLKEYERRLYALLSHKVKHSVMKTEMEDLDKITSNVDVPANAIKLFVCYMTRDEDLIKDLEQEVDVSAIAE